MEVAKMMGFNKSHYNSLRFGMLSMPISWIVSGNEVHVSHLKWQERQQGSCATRKSLGPEFATH